MVSEPDQKVVCASHEGHRLIRKLYRRALPSTRMGTQQDLDGGSYGE